MGAIKEIHYAASEIADSVIKDIYKQCDWQVGQFLSPDVEGDEFNEAHSYMMRTVARHIANKLDVTTNKYYDE